MGGICGGGGSSNQTTTSASSPPPQVLADYQGLVNRGTSVANTPYTPYPGELVAPLSNQTVTGLSNLNQYAYAAQPYLTQAGTMTQGAAAPVTMDQFSGSAVGQFENPFTSDVIQATQNEYANQNKQQAQFLNSQNIGAGAFGGDRAGVSQAILAGQQQTAQAPVIAGLNQANYNQALAEFNNQQQTGLGTQEFNRQQQGQMGNQYANIGAGLQTAGLQGAGQQITQGMIPQVEQQGIDAQLLNQWNQGQAYPFQATGFLGNLIEGIGSQSGGTAGTTTPGPSGLSQAIGLGTAGLGALGSFLSDIRVKENVVPVGKTFDGQTIHRYNFKGDPRTQIGLVAQEVEQSHPSAVHEGLGGLKHVDYGAATRESERAGFQGGGGLGAVSPGSVYDLGIGKGFSPSGALALLDPNSGAGAGTGSFGAGNLSLTPGGTLFRTPPSVRAGTALAAAPSGTQPLSPEFAGRGEGAGWAAPSAQGGPFQSGVAPYQHGQPGPMLRPTPAQADGGRVDRQTGGGLGYGNVQMGPIPQTPFIDFATPIAIAQGTGSPDPQSGIASIEFSAASQGSGNKNPPDVQVGTSNISPSLPNLSGAAPGTVFKPIDYQNPIGDFQTAGAENSLGPHWFTKGLFGENVYGGQGTAPAGTTGAVNEGELLARPGGPLSTDTPKTENPPPAAPAAAAPAPAAAAPARPGSDMSSRLGGGQFYSAHNYDQLSGKMTDASGNIVLRQTGGRIGRQDGGGLGDFSYYTPTTGNARGATYHPPVPAPAPLPSPPIRPPIIRHIAPRRVPVALPAVRSQAPPPLPPPRPTPPPPVGPVQSAPGSMPLPVLNPDETRDPTIRWPDQTYPRPPQASQRDLSLETLNPADTPNPGRFPTQANLNNIPIGFAAHFDPITGKANSIGEPDQLASSWEDRPGFNSGGVMGQMPLAGATGYTPQGHGVTGFDSQGSSMGAGSVARSASGGFGDLFDGGSKNAREGFAGGGLSGLGMDPATGIDPATAALLQITAFNPFKDVAPLPIGRGPPSPVQPRAQSGQSASDMAKTGGDIGSSLGKIIGAFSHPTLGPGQTGQGLADQYASVDPNISDFAGMNVDLNPSDFANFGLGGIVRPRRGFWNGGGDGDGDGTSAAAAAAAAADAAAAGFGGVGGNTGAPAGTSSHGTGSFGGGMGGEGVSSGTSNGVSASVGYGHGTSNTATNAGNAGSGGVGGVSTGSGATGGGGGGGGGGGATGGGGGTASGGSGTGQGGGHGPGTYGGSGQGVSFQDVYNKLSPAAQAVVNAIRAGLISPAAAADYSGNFGGKAGASGPGIGVDIGGGTTTVSQSPPGPGKTTLRASPLGGGGGGGGRGGIGSDANVGVSPAAIQALRDKLALLGPGQAAPNFGGQGFGSGSPATAQDMVGPGGPNAPSLFATQQPMLGTVTANPGGPSGGTVGAPTHMGVTAQDVAATQTPAQQQQTAAVRSGVVSPVSMFSAPTTGGERLGQLYRGGRTSFGLGGLIRPGFLDGGVGPGPPEPPQPPEEEPVAAVPAPAPAPASAAIAKTAAPAGAEPGVKPTRQQVLDYNASIASKYGNDPKVVHTLLGGEMGAKDPYQVGDAGSSFNPWQMHVGGINPAMPHPGMGDDYRAATGHDPNDWRYWQEQSDFAQKQLAEKGTTPWATTAGKYGLSRWSARGDGGGGVLAFAGGAGGGQDQQQQQQVQMNAAMDDAARPPDKKLLPPGIGDALMAAGFAMMAGTSPHAGVNIGQGALEGMKYYQSQRQLDREWQKNEAQIEDWHSLARYRDQSTALSVQNMDIERYKLQRDNWQFQRQQWLAAGGHGDPPPPPPIPASIVGSLSAPSKTVTPPAGPAPVSAPPKGPPAAPIPVTPGALVGPTAKPPGSPPAVSATATPPTTAKPASEAPDAAAAPPGREGPEWFKQQNIPDDQNPYELTRLATLYRASGDDKTAKEKQDQANAIWKDGIAAGVVIPSVAAAKANMEAQTKYKGSMGEAAGKDEGEIQAKMIARTSTNQTLERMKQLMQGFTPEHFAEQKASITAALVSAFGSDAVSASALEQAQSAQEFNKDAMTLIMQKAKDTGGRLLASEIETIRRGMPSAMLTPGATAAMIAQIQGGLKWQDDHDNTFLDWRDTHPADNPAKFERAWTLKKDENGRMPNSPQAYIDKARKNFPYAHDLDNQTPATLEDGRAYMTKQGPMRWNAQKQRFLPYVPEE